MDEWISKCGVCVYIVVYHSVLKRNLTRSPFSRRNIVCICHILDIIDATFGLLLLVALLNNALMDMGAQIPL